MSNDDTLTLFTDNRRNIVRYANTIVNDAGHAEDVTQEAFIRFQKKVRTETPRNSLTFLYRIVRNLAVDSKRRRKLEAALFINDIDAKVDLIAEDRTSLVNAAIAKEELNLVFMALQQLPDSTRIALEMHRFGV